LVADVPDQPVLGRVEDVVERDRQLDDAEPRAEMPACHRHGRNRLGAQLIGQLTQLLGRQFAQVLRHIHLVEQRRRGSLGHKFIPFQPSFLTAPLRPVEC
jgi:hypothetical protein